MKENKNDGLATASMILGITSIVTGIFGWIGIVCGTLAIIFAVITRNKIKNDASLSGSSSYAKAGLITGIIGVSFGIIVSIAVLLFFTAIAKDTDGDFEDAVENWENETERSIDQLEKEWELDKNN